MLILDTNVASELMRPSPAPNVVAWIVERDATAMHLTAVSEAELRFGVAVLQGVVEMLGAAVPHTGVQREIVAPADDVRRVDPDQPRLVQGLAGAGGSEHRIQRQQQSFANSMGRSVNDPAKAIVPRPTLQQRPVARGQAPDLLVRLDRRRRGFEIGENVPVDIAVGNPLRAHSAERDQHAARHIVRVKSRAHGSAQRLESNTDPCTVHELAQDLAGLGDLIAQRGMHVGVDGPPAAHFPGLRGRPPPGPNATAEPDAIGSGALTRLRKCSLAGAPR